MNLEQVSAALGEQLPERDVNIERSEARLEAFGNIAFIGFGIVLLAGVIGIIYTIVTKMILSGTQPLAGVILANFVAFAALTLAYIILKEDLNERKKKMRAASAPASESNVDIDTNKLLQDPIGEPTPSVVEDTTDLLHADSRKRRF